MPSSTALGQYLSARRELVRPEDVNVRTVGRRRVPGLRREELAMLAGISSDYYLRLEQGRDQVSAPRTQRRAGNTSEASNAATAVLWPC